MAVKDKAEAELAALELTGRIEQAKNQLGSLKQRCVITSGRTKGYL